MKRIVSLIIAALLCGSLLAGCGHDHIWAPASCDEPKTCISCGETEGTAPRHIWVDATCDKARHCSVCDKTDGYPLLHEWTVETKYQPSVCTLCGRMDPMSMPESGEIFIGADLELTSELTIRSASGESCYVKLKDSAGNDVFSFFVRAGDSLTVAVPSGCFYVFFAYGDEWYGPEALFGPDTTYGKDDEICDFENYAWEYTLYPTYDGNFSETPISADEF